MQECINRRAVPRVDEQPVPRVDEQPVSRVNIEAATPKQATAKKAIKWLHGPAGTPQANNNPSNEGTHIAFGINTAARWASQSYLSMRSQQQVQTGNYRAHRLSNKFLSTNPASSIKYRISSGN